MPAQAHQQPSGPSWHVAASGPSIKPWLPRLAEKPNLIAVNGMCLLLPKVPFWYMGDPIPQDSPIRKWLRKATGTKRFCTIHSMESGSPCEPLCISGTAFDDPDGPGNVNHTYFQFGSAAQTACGIAFKRKARRIYVWGLDYSDHQVVHPVDGCCRQPWKMDSIEEGWKRLRSGMQDLGAVVYNCNPGSRLQALEFADPEKAIKE